MTKWIIPAPVWVEQNGVASLVDRAGHMLGAIWPTRLGTWIAERDGHGKRFMTKAEARAWVEARVMEAMGILPDRSRDQ